MSFPSSQAQLPAYALPFEDILSRLATSSTQGLGPKEVASRQKRFGFNEFVLSDEEPLWQRVYKSLLENHLILLLLISAFISAALGHYEDAVSITLAILIVFTVGFIQEYRSEKSLEALKKLAPPHCHVIRDGKVFNTLARELVVGDVVIFNTGDRVPADVRLIESSELELDQSSLTGETEAIVKCHMTVHNEAVPVSERSNVAYMGTLVSNGSGKGVVYATAKDTEFGQVVELLQDMTEVKTPLQKAMDDLGRQLSYISFAIIGIIFLVGLFQGRKLQDMFNVGVSLAVAAIPEGLPVVVMVTLALGVLRMSKRNVIVKKMPAVETLGSINVLCVDKTGTLTENCMKVASVYTLADNKFSNADASIPLNDKLQQLLAVSNLCNTAYIGSDGEWRGQSTDVGLMQFSQSLGIADQRKELTRVSEVPFSSLRKWMAITYSDGLTYFKGGAEATLERCSSLEIKETVDAAVTQMTSQGLRVIALAYTKDPGSNPHDVAQLTFVGLIGMQDPPRDTIAPTIDWLLKAQIHIVMITGDAKDTALSIASAVGMPVGNITLSGAQIDMLGDHELEEVATHVSLFYRTTPNHKMRIVKAFQNRGCVVAMTGDGVNDAPALKIADIGIAMGCSGTDVAKEAADMILVKDDLSSLINAVEEGKAIFANIQCFITFQLSTSVAALSLIAIATTLGFSNPLNAMQILWINILMDGPPAQSLGVEPADPDVVFLPPRPRSQSILSHKVLVRILINAVMIVAGTLFIYARESKDGEVTARDTTMTFTCFVLFDMFNALSCRSLTKPILLSFSNRPHHSRPTNYMFIGSVTGSIVGHCLVVYVPFFQKIFLTTSISLYDWAVLIFLASSIFWVNDFLKLYTMHQSPLADEESLLAESQELQFLPSKFH
ncbi:High affinity Ca2+/Mn2+ P-type ATPase-like protein [Entomophthora muscae]|uniref:High affinity Ca2+/Mn2+ P-type ATPase-like protein n=2 Tax=Entomophthora muscae TaxID=34485 RepID=A0ACC2UHG0_9FUNG|nr:High affinity Ca2+/Mn2+ P-type ATPase-like protein [Entomophthora muscae]